MPRIPTFDAGEGRLQPSEAGSAAFREAGAITQRNAARVGQMISQVGSSFDSAISAIGKPLGKMQENAQEHTDAMAEIDFQKQLVQSEIAAKGRVNTAGTPTTADGSPINDHIGRGSDTPLPSDATVPSTGSYAVAASGALQGHGSFLENLIGNITGTGISQKARDRMALEAAKSNMRLQVHAASVANEVAIADAFHSTDQTVSTILGGISRDANSLPHALDQIESTYNAFQGTLTGDYAEKGAQFVLKNKEATRRQAIWTGIYSKIQAGDIAGAQAIVNDPRYDKDIGGLRDQYMEKITGAVQKKIQDQNQQDKVAKDQLDAKRNQLIDNVAKNLQQPPEQQDPNLSRGMLELSGLWKNDRDGLNQAYGTLDEALKKSIDPQRSQVIADGVNKGIIEGTITNNAQIDAAAFDENHRRRITIEHERDLKTALKDQQNNPATREFNGAVKEWLDKNEAQIDVSVGTGGLFNKINRTDLGQQNVSRWIAEVKRRSADMIRKGDDPHSLLDPSSPNSMVSPQALAPYRTTLQMNQQYQSNQKAMDKTIEQQRAAGQTPTLETPKEAPDALKNVPGIAFNKSTQQWYDPAKKQFYNIDGTPAKMSLQAPAQSPPSGIVTLPRAMSPDEIKKNYPPKTRFYIPDGSGRIGTVPGKQSMNYAPEGSAIASSDPQQAINAALQPRPDAHLDKNLFSSGRYAELGIKGGVGENLTPIDVQGQSIKVNAQAAPHFKGFLDELTARGYKIESLGGFNERMKRGSLSSYSEHAFGNAIDINPGANPFHSRETNLPKDVSRLAAKYGLIWGGDWNGRSSDPMHFEWSGKGGQTQFAGLR